MTDTSGFRVMKSFKEFQTFLFGGNLAKKRPDIRHDCMRGASCYLDLDLAVVVRFLTLTLP